MKANRHIIISIILAIFLSFSTPLNGFGLSVFPDNMYTESFRQVSCINLQFALILKNNNDFEEKTPEDDLSTCLCSTINHLRDVEIYFYNKKCVSVKQILFFEETSRSPPFI